MPTISMFYGIIIRMYFAPGEHNPPHFHVYYNQFKKTRSRFSPFNEELLEMYPAVTHVTPRQDFSLALVFDTGEEGILDMKPYLDLDFGVFNRLKDYNNFRRVRVVFDTVEWDCGVDLDPEFIHAKSKITDRETLAAS